MVSLKKTFVGFFFFTRFESDKSGENIAIAIQWKKTAFLSMENYLEINWKLQANSIV